MFILDRPFVSDFLQETAVRLGLPVLDAEPAHAMTTRTDIPFTAPDQFLELATAENARIYCNSENSVGWICEYLAFSELPDFIETFKNKAVFRELLEGIYPDFWFMEVDFDDLDLLDLTDIPKPFVIKPSVGFFSIGVHRVETEADWPAALEAIRREVREARDRFPESVVDLSTFLIEQVIEGKEYAADVYWDSEGEPVILNILHHPFAESGAVNDRLYMTSRDIVAQTHDTFLELFQDIGEMAGLRNFPAHVELRADAFGTVIPIEANPMRFAGWCVTDIARHAWGINPYEYYLRDLRPDWEKLLNEPDDRIFSMVLGDIGPEYPLDTIRDIDYDRFLAHFSKPLELRRTDWKRFGCFAFLFAETDPADTAELDQILRSDMSEFLIR